MFTTRAIAAASAAFILSVASPGMAQETDPAALMAAQEPIAVGELTITQAWARATPPGAPTAAGYLTITNAGADDRLVSVAATIADTTELHEMIVTDDRMIMRPVEDGLAIGVGETIVLQPGGFHFMFVGVGDGLVEGAIVDVSLTFANAGTINVSLVVFPIGSEGPAIEGAGVGGMGAMGM